MTLAIAAHDAVHDALAATAETDLYALVRGRVYDRTPPPMPTYPYLTMGEIEIIDDANTASNSSEVHITVHIWSNTVGSVQAKQIGGMVRRILAPDDPDDTLEIEGFYTIVSAFDVEVYRPGDDPVLTEGVLTFTYLTDPQ